MTISGAFEGAGTVDVGAGVSVGGGKAGVLLGPTLGTAWSGGRFEGTEGLGVTGEVVVVMAGLGVAGEAVVVAAGLNMGLLGLVSCPAGGCSGKAAEALITGWDSGVVTVAGGPAGASPSLMEAALTVNAPSLAEAWQGLHSIAGQGSEQGYCCQSRL